MPEGPFSQIRAQMCFGVNCIQTFYLGRYILRYRVGNLVLPGHASSTVKCDFGRYICRYYTSREFPIQNFHRRMTDILHYHPLL